MIFKDFTIGIATKDRTDSLIETIKSISESSVLPSEIVIADQTTNVEERMKIQGFIKSTGLNIKYLSCDPGLTIARNFILDNVENDILLFVDDDITLDKDCLEKMYETISKDDVSLVCAYDKLHLQKSNVLGYIACHKSFFKRTIGHITSSFYGRYPTFVNDSKRLIKTEWGMGYFFCIKKSLVSKWNLKFDTNLGKYAYAEDADFTYSYYKKSKEEFLNCYIDKGCGVYHHVSNQNRLNNKRIIYKIYVNRWYLAKKHNFNKFDFLIMGWSNFCDKISCIGNKELYSIHKSANKYLKSNKKEIINKNYDCIISLDEIK